MIRVIGTKSGALRRRLREISAEIDPKSRSMSTLRTDIKKILVEDGINMLTHYGSGVFAGADRNGRDLAPPADSTRKKWPSRGMGFVLAPRGLASRTITKFEVRWVRAGDAWRVLCGWKGIPWIQYHLTGSDSHPLYPKWRLPKLDVTPPSRKGWVILRERFARFTKNVLDRRGSRSSA